MLARKLSVVCLTGVVCLGTLAGCFAPAPWSATGNQGGSTPVSLGMKLLDVTQGTGTLQALNPDDLQLMAQLAGDITGVAIPEVSDELADAAIQVMNANNLQTFEDLADLRYADPEDIIIPDEVRDVLISEIQELFGDLSMPDLAEGIVGRHAPTYEI